MAYIRFMNLRSIDLKLLTVFGAILEGNLTRASKQLGLGQPAMSNALSRLRAALDDPLFVRTAQGMIPTSRARLIGQPIQQALDLIQAGLRQGTAFDYSSSTRTFVIAVNSRPYKAISFAAQGGHEIRGAMRGSPIVLVFWKGKELLHSLTASTKAFGAAIVNFLSAFRDSSTPSPGPSGKSRYPLRRSRPGSIRSPLSLVGPTISATG